MIRKVILLFLLLLVSVIDLTAQQARFDQANNFLNQQRFDLALEQYKEIEQDGFVSGALYMNTGIAYIYLDSLGMAKYYFLKAKQFKETEGIAADGLSFLESRFSRRSAVLPPLPWQTFLSNVSDQIGFTSLILFSLILINLAVGILVLSWYGSRSIPYKKWISLSLITISAMLIVLALIVRYQDIRFDRAVMIDPQANVFERPDQNSTVISISYEGYLMTVDNNRSQDGDNWQYVRLANGMYGWIESHHIKTL
jgi:hypothetical protein